MSDKPKLKFSLTVSPEYNSGFKLNVIAMDNEAMKIADELTRLLIEKIEKITVELRSDTV